MLERLLNAAHVSAWTAYQLCMAGFGAVKCSSISDSLLMEPLSRLSAWLEDRVWIFEIEASISSLVTPCFMSYSICLHTFAMLPYFLWFLLSQLLASAERPLTYFRTVFCMCSTCHCLIGKLFCT